MAGTKGQMQMLRNNVGPRAGEPAWSATHPVTNDRIRITKSSLDALNGVCGVILSGIGERRVFRVQVDKHVDTVCSLTPDGKSVTYLYASEFELVPSCMDCDSTGVEKSGVCHCGDSMDGHSIYSNHDPVEMTRPCQSCTTPKTEKETV